MSALELSVDRPFAVYLFDYFNQFYILIVGQSAKDFHFVQGVTPLSTLSEGKGIIGSVLDYTKLIIVLFVCSPHWLYHLLRYHLWRSVLTFQRTCSQAKESQSYSQCIFDDHLLCSFGLVN
jgi:hypothetical protein